jgi:DNA invertase Pin-like site-specific DNA recombinase
MLGGKPSTLTSQFAQPLGMYSISAITVQTDRAKADELLNEVVGIFKETGSGAKLDRAERRKVMVLAQARHIDAVLVTELSRWGRSTTDLLATLKELEARRVSVIALNGMAFDLATPMAV